MSSSGVKRNLRNMFYGTPDHDIISLNEYIESVD
jgi:hypothetical protein